MVGLRFSINSRRQLSFNSFISSSPLPPPSILRLLCFYRYSFILLFSFLIFLLFSVSVSLIVILLFFSFSFFMLCCCPWQLSLPLWDHSMYGHAVVTKALDQSLWPDPGSLEFSALFSYWTKSCSVLGCCLCWNLAHFCISFYWIANSCPSFDFGQLIKAWSFSTAMSLNRGLVGHSRPGHYYFFDEYCSQPNFQLLRGLISLCCEQSSNTLLLATALLAIGFIINGIIKK